MNRKKILEQGSKYANEHWDVLEKPNEHDNAHDDFIAGALWVVKNCSIPNVRLSFVDWLKGNEPLLVNHGGSLNLFEIEQRYIKYTNEA